MPRFDLFAEELPISWDDLTRAEQLQKSLDVEHDPIVFCEDPYFLGRSITETWPMQKEIIRRFELGVPDGTHEGLRHWDVNEWMEARQRAFDHEKLDDWMLENYQHYTELVIEAGMRSSKTTIAGWLGLYGAFKLLNMRNPGEYFGLRKDQELYIINVATSDDQAFDTIFAVEKGFIVNSPFFRNFQINHKHNEFFFPQKKMLIRCGGSNSGSLVGRTIYRALFDELARFQDTRGRRSGFEVYAGLGRGVTSVRDPGLPSEHPWSQQGKKIAISSVLYDNDIIDNLVKMSKDISSMLGYKYATWEMNPNLTEAALRDEFLKDPDRAWRDFGSQPGMVVEGYYRDPTVIVFNDKRLNPLLLYEYGNARYMQFADWFMGKPGVDYYLTGDPAVKMDNFGIALGHLEEDVVVVDFVHEIAPRTEVDPSEVEWIVKHINSRFNVREFIVDQWNYPETLAQLRNEGVRIEFHVVKKPEHDKLKECFYMKQLDCYPYEELRTQLSALEVIRQTKVDHPRKGKKDVADAVANLAFRLKGEYQEMVGVLRTRYFNTFDYNVRNKLGREDQRKRMTRIFAR